MANFSLIQYISNQNNPVGLVFRKQNYQLGSVLTNLFEQDNHSNITDLKLIYVILLSSKYVLSLNFSGLIKMWIR